MNKRVLVACEYSGTVRDAFSRLGWDAWSCDILPTESELTKREGKHIQADALSILNDGWDLMIGHPPCTYLCVAGLHYSKKDPVRMKKTKNALMFFLALYNSDIPHIALENPVGCVSTAFRKPDQIINPYQFWEPERKKTCLWLKNLPALIPQTNLEVKPIKTIIRKTGAKAGQPYNYYWRQGKSAHERSKTFEGIARAMAEQWGKYLISQMA